MIYPNNFEQKIGFDEIRRIVRGRCISSLGTEQTDRAALLTSAEDIQEELEKIREFTRFSAEEDGVYEENFFDVRQQLLRMRPERTHLEEIDLFDLKRSLESIHQLVSFFGRNQNEDAAAPPLYKYPALQRRSADVRTFPEIVRRIDEVLNKYGKVKDTASPELLSIRHEMETVVRSISHTLRNIIHEAQDEGYIERNVSPTMRDGRLVIPVNPALKRKIKGIVHDESATGKTVFIEPAAVVEANNRIRELKAAEKREIIKILQAIAAEIRPHITEIVESLVFLGEIDFIRAKMLFAHTIHAVLPTVAGRPCVEWYQAVHPLLQLSLEKHGKKVVPLDVKLSETDRVLLISGPNAGGKSICLKTVGLLQYMVQCGFPVPLHESSVVGVFDHIFLDIGDDQNLENDLSTYSSHLIHMKQMIKESDEKSLLLIDEFGSGTEPQIGGAIAEAILKRFLENKVFGVITTHFQNLKAFAETHAGIVNGAMLYDLQQLQPLFILQIGSPGSSFALEIARKIGIPSSVMEDAAQLVGQDYIMSDRYLQEINRDKRYWENKRQNIRKREKQLEEILARYETEMQELQTKRKELLSQAKEEAENLLKASNAKIEQTIRTIREAQAEKERTKEVRRELDTFREEVSKEDDEKEDLIARKIEQIKQRQERSRKRKEEKKNQPPQSPTSTVQTAKAPAALRRGDNVRIKGQSSVGKIESVQGKTARVLFGVMYTTVPVNRLERVAQPPKAALSEIVSSVGAATRQTIDDRKLNFKTDIDLRGFRGDEAINAVRYFIDDAIMLGVPRVRILHGTGTGALRQLIRQYLGVTPGVHSFRDEHVQLGGAGITVVDLE